MIPGVNLVNLFWHKFTRTFCKLVHFITISNICCIVMKRYSLQKRVSKFMSKKFYEIDPWWLCITHFLRLRSLILLLNLWHFKSIWAPLFRQLIYQHYFYYTTDTNTSESKASKPDNWAVHLFSLSITSLLIRTTYWSFCSYYFLNIVFNLGFEDINWILGILPLLSMTVIKNSYFTD